MPDKPTDKESAAGRKLQDNKTPVKERSTAGRDLQKSSKRLDNCLNLW